MKKSKAPGGFLRPAFFLRASYSLFAAVDSHASVHPSSTPGKKR
jgi:hypothetical protein